MEDTTSSDTSEGSGGTSSAGMGGAGGGTGRMDATALDQLGSSEADVFGVPEWLANGGMCEKPVEESGKGKGSDDSVGKGKGTPGKGVSERGRSVGVSGMGGRPEIEDVDGDEDAEKMTDSDS